MDIFQGFQSNSCSFESCLLSKFGGFRSSSLFLRKILVQRNLVGRDTVLGDRLGGECRGSRLNQLFVANTPCLGTAPILGIFAFEFSYFSSQGVDGNLFLRNGGCDLLYVGGMC